MVAHKQPKVPALGEWADIPTITKALGVKPITLHSWRTKRWVRAEQHGKSPANGSTRYLLRVADVLDKMHNSPKYAGRHGLAPALPDDATGLKALTDAFLAARESQGFSPSTLESYRFTFAAMARRYEHLPTQPEQLERFLAVWPHMVTRETNYKRLAAFYRWLVKRKRLAPENNPIAMMDAPRIRPMAARGLTRDELRRLFGYPHAAPMRLFLQLPLDCGLRLSEAWGLRLEDVKDDTVIVRGKNGAREVPISPKIRDELRAMLPFPWKSPRSAGQLVRRAFHLAGLSGKRASYHTLRVTFARLWKGDKLALKGIGGWASWKMVEHYRPYDLDEAVAQHQRFSPLLALNEDGAA